MQGPIFLGPLPGSTSSDSSGRAPQAGAVCAKGGPEPGVPTCLGRVLGIPSSNLGLQMGAGQNREAVWKVLGESDM